jgi:hypothetical protein
LLDLSAFGNWVKVFVAIGDLQGRRKLDIPESWRATEQHPSAAVIFAEGYPSRLIVYLGGAA